MSSTNQTRNSCNEGGNNNYLVAIHWALNVTADVLSYICINRKENKRLKKKAMYFFDQPLRLLISSLSFTLLMLLNNLPISLDGPLNYLHHVSMKVETYYIILNPKLKINPKWFEKYMPNCVRSFFSVS